MVLSLCTHSLVREEHPLKKDSLISSTEFLLKVLYTAKRTRLAVLTIQLTVELTAFPEMSILSLGQEGA